MPRGDGTGPIWLGRGTGRGRGWCSRIQFPGDSFSSKGFGFLSALAPIAIAVIRDSVNPKVLLESISRKLLGKRDSIQGSREIKANYKVIDDTALKGNTEEKN